MSPKDHNPGPYRDQPVLSREEVRSMLRDIVVEVIPDVVEAVLASRPYKMRVDEEADALERGEPSRDEAEQVRVQLGMSPDLARLMDKLNRGVDPTPGEFEMPRPESYFRRSVKFEAAYLLLVKGGRDLVVAYEMTCEMFGWPSYPRASALDRALADVRKIDPNFQIAAPAASLQELTDEFDSVFGPGSSED